jgi:hypothetical protein
MVMSVLCRLDFGPFALAEMILQRAGSGVKGR